MGVFESLRRDIEALAVPVDGPALAEVIGLRDRLNARIAETVAAFEQSGRWADEGATSVTAWLTYGARMSRGTASRTARVSRRVSRLPLTMAMWRDGTLSDGQVEAIAANLDAETVGLFAEHEGEVVPTLVGLTVDGVASAMSHWRALATEDREPVEHPQGLRLSRGLNNRWALDGTLDAETGQLLTTALRVAKSDDVEGEPPRSPAERRADALADICRHFLDNQGKNRGGRHRPHVNAIIDLDRLLAGHAAAECPDGTVLSHATITRLLCDCALHRVVTRGGSAILDYGRTTRTIPAPLFNALVVRDRHCRFPGCDRPASWADGHHLRHWTNGGPTTLENLVLLCRWHHRKLHQPRWHAKLLPDATLEVTTPTGHVRSTTPALARPPNLSFAEA
jgi:hypothetical protein